MIRVFLAVEGPNDGGALGRSPQARANDPLNEGALQPLVRNIAGTAIELRGQSTTQMFLGDFPDPAHAPGRRARKAAMLAAEDNCDVVVFHMDVDGVRMFAEPSNAWATVDARVAEGFQLATTEDGSEVRCVAAMPCRTIEAWLLADHDALSPDTADADRTLDQAVPEPERLWGDNRQGTQHPKQVFRRAIGGNRPRAATRDYRRLAEVSAIGIISARCPASFAPFEAALRSALAVTES